MIRVRRIVASALMAIITVTATVVETAPAVGPETTCVTRQLAYGARGEDVKVAQRWLTVNGFSPGRIDGWYGPRTTSAMRSAERAHDWRTDGVFSKAEISAAGLSCAGKPSGGNPRRPTPPAPTPAPAPAPTPQTGIDPAYTSLPVEVYIPKLGLRRTIRSANDYNAQELINACNGAVNLPSWFDSPVYLAAHRTHCGNKGFGGVETLKPGDVVTITYANGQVRNYIVHGTTIGITGSTPTSPAGGAPVALQTSQSSTRVYIISCWPAK